MELYFRVNYSLVLCAIPYKYYKRPRNFCRINKSKTHRVPLCKCAEIPDKYKQTTQKLWLSWLAELPAFTACQPGKRKPTSLSPLLLQHIPGSCNSECPRTFPVASQQDVFRFVWEACHLCNNCHPDTDTVALWDHRRAASLESLTVILVISCSRRASLYLAQLSTFWVNTQRQLERATDGGSGKTNATCIAVLQIVNKVFLYSMHFRSLHYEIYFVLKALGLIWTTVWNCWKFIMRIFSLVGKQWEQIESLLLFTVLCCKIDFNNVSNCAQICLHIWTPVLPRPNYMNYTSPFFFII